MRLKPIPLALACLFLLQVNCLPKRNNNSSLRATVGTNPGGIEGKLCSTETIKKVCQEEDVQSQQICVRQRVADLTQCLKDARESRTNASNKVAGALKDKAGPVVSQLTAEEGIAATQAARVQEVLNRYRPRLEEAKSLIQTTVSNYKLKYKDIGEKELTQALAAQTARAQATDRLALLDVRYQLDKIAVDDSAKIRQLKREVVDCQATINFLSYWVKSEIGDDAGFMERNGIEGMLDPFRDFKPVLESIATYAEHRSRRVQEEVDRLKALIDQRIERLRRLEVDKETQDSISKSAHLTSLSQFYSEIEGVRTAAFRTGPSSSKTKLPHYADQYGSLVRFLNYGVYCKAIAKPAWMDSGCLRFTSFESQAISLMNAGIPKYVMQNIALMATLGSPAPEAVRNKVRELVTARKFEEGIALYDAILDAEAAP